MGFSVSRALRGLAMTWAMITLVGTGVGFAEVLQVNDFYYSLRNESGILDVNLEKGIGLTLYDKKGNPLGVGFIDWWDGAEWYHSDWAEKPSAEVEVRGETLRLTGIHIGTKENAFEYDVTIEARDRTFVFTDQTARFDHTGVRRLGWTMLFDNKLDNFYLTEELYGGLYQGDEYGISPGISEGVTAVYDDEISAAVIVPDDTPFARAGGPGNQSYNVFFLKIFEWETNRNAAALMWYDLGQTASIDGEVQPGEFHLQVASAQDGDGDGLPDAIQSMLREVRE